MFDPDVSAGEHGQEAHRWAIRPSRLQQASWLENPLGASGYTIVCPNLAGASFSASWLEKHRFFGATWLFQAMVVIIAMAVRSGASLRTSWNHWPQPPAGKPPVNS